MNRSRSVGLEIRDAQVLERVVPALAPFRRHAFRDGVRDLVLVAGAPNELDELRLASTRSRASSDALKPGVR